MTLVNNHKLIIKSIDKRIYLIFNNVVRVEVGHFHN